MNAPEERSRPPDAARDEHLRPPADRAVARPRLLGLGHRTASATSTAWAASPSTPWANHPKLVPALQEQIAKLIHCSNYYEVPLQEQLAPSCARSRA
jgi:hypothetical protein